ncbi:4992_t:CDS:2, partial [Dentiscutata heterogama]
IKKDKHIDRMGDVDRKSNVDIVIAIIMDKHRIDDAGKHQMLDIVITMEMVLKSVQW